MDKIKEIYRYCYNNILPVIGWTVCFLYVVGILYSLITHNNKLAEIILSVAVIFYILTIGFKFLYNYIFITKDYLNHNLITHEWLVKNGFAVTSSRLSGGELSIRYTHHMFVDGHFCMIDGLLFLQIQNTCLNYIADHDTNNGWNKSQLKQFFKLVTGENFKENK